jgi:hypothetical protein
MYGAIPYLMREFNLDREHAFKVICEWLDQQSQAPVEPAPRKPVRRRAA